MQAQRAAITGFKKPAPARCKAILKSHKCHAKQHAKTDKRQPGHAGIEASQPGQHNTKTADQQQKRSVDHPGCPASSMRWMRFICN
jgi:hypothetical protein